MNLRFLTLLAAMFWLGQGAFAQDAIPTETPTPALTRPMTLSVKERIPDSKHYNLPRPPSKYIDGTAMELDIDVDNPPFGPPILNLSDSTTLPQVPGVNKSDSSSGKYYWHPFEGWNYCHFKKDGLDWYGWRTGDAFHWVLWWDGRFWWHDEYAERWIYFNQGCWWWQNPRKLGNFQVFLQDGHYHVCDANGALGDDLMRTGKEEIVTEPIEKETPYGHKGGDALGGPGGGGGGSFGGMH
jgi:hypothetical protein